MNIGVDIDGVLARFDAEFSKLIAYTSQRNLFPHFPYDPPCWDWYLAIGYTKDEEKVAWDYVKRSEHFWRTLPAYPTAQKDIGRLIDEAHKGNSVYFATDRPGVKTKWQTERWLYDKGYLGTTHLPTVLVTPSKGQTAAALRLDCYIDDKPENCQDVLKHQGLKTQVFLQDRPWNQSFNEKYVTRVGSVIEMLDIVQKESSVQLAV